MASKILNLPDALKLATVLGKYIQEFPNPDTTTVLDLLDSVFQKITPEDFKTCIELFTGKPLDTETSGNDLLKIFSDGIERNKVITLLMTSKEIGII